VDVPRKLELKGSRRMISVVPVPGCAIPLEANWNKIQFLLGHRSVETTERYLGSRQRLVHAVNDRLGIEPESGSS
jgi:integrase